MLELLERGEPAFDREHWVPGHFTASAFVLDATGQHLLLIHHRKLRRWLQPGGHVEPRDADVLAAARREVTEETGLTGLANVGTGLFDLDIHEIPNFGTNPAHLHFDLRVLFRADDSILTSNEVVSNEEVSGVRWVPLSGLALETDDASVLRVAEKLGH